MTHSSVFDFAFVYYGWMVGVLSLIGLGFSLYFSGGQLLFMETWKNSESYTTFVAWLGGVSTFFFLIAVNFLTGFHWGFVVIVAMVVALFVGLSCKVDPVAWRFECATVTKAFPWEETETENGWFLL